MSSWETRSCMEILPVKRELQLRSTRAVALSLSYIRMNGSGSGLSEFQVVETVWWNPSSLVQRGVPRHRGDFA